MSFKQYRQLEKGEFIVIGGDTASGGLDYSASQFLSKTKLDVPIVYHSKQTTTSMVNDLVPKMEWIFDQTGIPPVIALERNNGGSFEMDRLAMLNRANKYRLYVDKGSIGQIDPVEGKKYGWTTSSATRPKMLEDLKNAIDNRLLRIYEKQTIKEMFSFIIVQTSSSWKAQAEKNAHDDLIMSLAIAWQLYQTEQPEEDFKHGIEELPNEQLFSNGGFY